MEKYLLIYYTESKYIQHLKRNVKYFDYEDDLMEFIDNQFINIVDFSIYKKTSCLDISKILYNKTRGDNNE